MRPLPYLVAAAAACAVAAAPAPAATARPDLRVTIAPPAGDQAIITIANTGTASAPASWLRVVRSADAVAGNGDRAVLRVRVPALAARASVRQNVLANGGGRWLIACADAIGQVAEIGEGDDCGCTPLRPALAAASSATSALRDCPGGPRPGAGGLTSLWQGAGGDGWTGGDGTWSVALPDGRIAWLFGDTYMGGVSGDGSRGAIRLVRNSLVVQSGGCLTTMVSGTGADQRSFVDSGDPDRWWWPAQPLVEGGALRVLMGEIRRTGDGDWDFAGAGTSLATVSLPDLTLQSVQRVGPPDARVLYGASATVAGGWTYVYGVEDHGLAKYLTVARAPAGRLDGAWAYWDGSGWSADPDAAVRIASDVSNQVTVVPAAGGGFTLITQRSGFSREVVTRQARQPQGPWSPPRRLTTIPDPGAGAITYNALVHPALSAPGRWTLSYNVNGATPADVLADAGLYRPHFLDVTPPGGA